MIAAGRYEGGGALSLQYESDPAKMTAEFAKEVDALNR
jgi:hypothetical protein